MSMFQTITSDVEDVKNLHKALSDLLDIDHTYERRDFGSTMQLLTYVWDQAFEDEITRGNISIAISGCQHRARWSTVVGEYTFAEGRINRNTTFGEMTDDLKALKSSKLDHFDSEQALANHTLTKARSVAAMSNDILQNHLICKDSMLHSGSEIIHDELRKLLWDRQSVTAQIKEYGVLLFASTLAGLLGSLVTGFGAAYNLHLEPPTYPFNTFVALLQSQQPGFLPPNLQASIADYLLYGPSNKFLASYQSAFSKYQQDISIRKLEARNTVIVTGATIFIATLSSGIVNDIMSRRRLRGEQAIAANALLAHEQGVLTDIINRVIAGQQYVPAHTTGNSPIAAPATPSSTSFSTSYLSYYAPPRIFERGLGCVSAADAAAIAASMNQVDTTAPESQPPTNINIQPHDRIEQELLTEVLVDERCQIPSIPCPQLLSAVPSIEPLLHGAINPQLQALRPLKTYARVIDKSR